MIVLAQKTNQLGNRLLVSAHVLALAAETGRTLINVSIPEYAQYFKGPSQDWLCRYPPRRSFFAAGRSHDIAYRIINFVARILWRAEVSNRFVRTLTWRDRHSRDDFDLCSPAFVSIARSTPVLVIRGNRLRGYDLFHKHADLIRAYFAPTDEIAARVDSLVRQARMSTDVLVGVHVRRGDYARFQDGRWFYSNAQYQAIMMAIAGLLEGRRVRFLVCTDAPNDLGDFPGLDVVRGNGKFVDEMQTLARCDYIVGPPSTFSRWAAFYGRVPIHVLDVPEPPASMEAFAIPRH